MGYPGETGMSYWRTVETGNVRVRMVEFSPDFLGEQWCSQGHVFLVLEGELVIELANGEEHTMRPGTSFQASEGCEPRRAFTRTGARVFIVD